MAKIPSNKQAISVTVGALLNLLAAFAMVTGHTSPFRVILFGLCEVVLIAAAIQAWAKYVKAYIAYEVERQVSLAVGGAQEESK